MSVPANIGRGNYLIHNGRVFDSDINMNFRPIQNVLDPTQPLDAVNLQTLINYAATNSLDITSYSITLTGNTPFIMADLDLTGVYQFYIESTSTLPSIGPYTYILASKKSASRPGLFQQNLNHPGDSSAEAVTFTWPAGQRPTFFKTGLTSFYDGSYRVTVKNMTAPATTLPPQVFSITLSGTSQTSLPDPGLLGRYEMIVQPLDPSIVDGPTVHILTSKLSSTQNAISSLDLAGSGLATGEVLQFSWLAGEVMKFSKSGSNYDGVYRVTLTHLLG